jgi:phage terminase large subunit-like protein
MAVWDEAEPQTAADELLGRQAWIGVDLSKSYDLTAISLAFRDDDGGYTVLTFAFLPETAFRRRVKELPDVPWHEWRGKELIVIPGDLIDEDVIEAKLRELSELYDVQEIAFDPKFAAKIMSRLLDDGMPVIEMPQTITVLGPVYTEMQRAIIGRRLRHGGNPLLRFCVSNAVPKTGDTGLLYISKAKSTDAIDCLVAACMAFGRASAGESSASIYSGDSRPDGLLFV